MIETFFYRVIDVVDFERRRGGFVCYHRGWHDLRRDDLGVLWEHLVLNELHAHLGRGPIHYWRSNGNDVDFVLVQRGAPPVAIERRPHGERGPPSRQRVPDELGLD